MRKTGELVQWNDERGFGFIRDNDGKRHFVHISDIRRAETRPQPGDRLTFDPATGPDGRPVAKSAVIMGATPRPKREEPPSRRVDSRLVGGTARFVMAAAIILAALAATQMRLAPGWVLIAYLVFGIVSMGLYWFDKSAAEDGRWRIRETSLHLADFIGGIAGGLIAQALLRHKTRKASFAAASWTIAAVHLALLVAITLGFLRLPDVLWFS